MDFAERLKEIRMSKDLSQQQLADMVFVDRSSVARWESGTRMPDAVMIAAIPEASIYGFTKPSEAMEFARNTPVDLAFLDIEMGKRSGLTVCKDLLDINPKTNVVFLTAYEGYSLDAWNTGASGFLMKPLTVEAVQKQLPLLRNRIRGLSNG